MPSTHPNARAALLAAVALLSLAAGCGGSNKTTVDVRGATTGQQLQDLQAAYDKGLLTEAEYQKQRKAILEAKK